MKFGVHEFWRTPHVVDIGDYTWVVEILWQAYFISFKTQWSNGITRYDIILYLVGGLEHGFYDFPYIGNSNPNWLIFIRGVETTSQIWYDMIWYDMRIMEHHFLVLSVTFGLFLSSSDLWVFAWVGIISNRRMSHCFIYIILYIYNIYHDYCNFHIVYPTKGFPIDFHISISTTIPPLISTDIIPPFYAYIYIYIYMDEW